MSHDEIKAATRRRMAQTGEPYCLARRRVIEEHQRAAGRPVNADRSVPMVSAAFNAQALKISRMADEVAKNVAGSALNSVAAAITANMQQVSRMADEAVAARTRAAIAPVSVAMNVRALEISRIADEAVKLRTATWLADRD